MAVFALPCVSVRAGSVCSDSRTSSAAAAHAKPAELPVTEPARHVAGRSPRRPRPPPRATQRRRRPTPRHRTSRRGDELAAGRARAEDTGDDLLGSRSASQALLGLHGAGASVKAGRGIWRGIYSSMTSHPDYQVLSSHARLTLLTLRLGGQSTIAGIGRVYMEALVAETGLSRRQVNAALCELEQKPSPEAPWIVRDENLIWIRNALRFDPTLTLNNSNHVPPVQRAVAALPRSSQVVQRFRSYYRLPEEGEEVMGTSDGASHEGTHEGRDGASHGGIRSSSGTPTPILNRTPIPSPGGSLSLVSNQNQEPGKGSEAPLRRPAPGEYQETLERVRAQHKDWTELQVQDEALKILQASL